MERTEQTVTAAPGAAPRTPAAPGAVPSVPPEGTVTTAGEARALAEATVRAQGGRAVRDEDVIDLLLVVSELVTNAIRHGGGLAGFDVRTVDEGVWIAVHDHSPVIPRAVHAFPTRHHGSGYGWPLVVRLARDISVTTRPEGGKTISVLVPMRPAAGA
jgi:anti-sigma regulatory factor (Ser/Thr protein kinase)